VAENESNKKNNFLDIKDYAGKTLVLPDKILGNPQQVKNYLKSIGYSDLKYKRMKNHTAVLVKKKYIVSPYGKVSILANTTKTDIRKKRQAWEAKRTDYRKSLSIEKALWESFDELVLKPNKIKYQAWIKEKMKQEIDKFNSEE
jgi:hypothetical protein